MGWERAAFTLRTNDTAAATQIPAPEAVYGEELGSENSFTDGNDGANTKRMVRDFNGERNPIGIHQSGEDVSIAFDADRASSGNYDNLYNQDRVQLVAARMKPEEGDGVPVTSDGAIELLSDVDSANEDASFQMLEGSAALDSEGQLKTSESFGPGHYVVFAVVHEDSADGISVDSNSKISVDGDVVLVGMDQLTVQKGAASVDAPSNQNPGDSLTFDVDSSETFDSSNDGEMTHIVAVYEKDTFENARFDSVVDQSELGSDFSQSEDMELEHSISHVNGVSNVEDGTTLNQNDLSEGKTARQVEFGSMVDFIATDLDGETVRTDNIMAGGADNSEYEQMDASLTVVNGEDPSTDVTVDTFGNFSTGEYQYVVISMQDDNDSQLSSTTGTIDLESESNSGGGNGDGPHWGNPDDDGDDSDSGEDDSDDSDETDTDSPDNTDESDDSDTPDTATPVTTDESETTEAPAGGDGSDGGDGGEETTSGDGPGFTAAIALVALIAAALLAVRREN